MAVKQNTEGNGTTDANQVNGNSTVKSKNTGTKSKNMNQKSVNSDLGVVVGPAAGGALGNTSNTDLPGCSGNTGASAKLKLPQDVSGGGIGGMCPPSGGKNSGVSNFTMSTPSNDIGYILHWIEVIEANQAQMDLGKEIIKIYQHLIVKLARVQIPRQSAEDLKRFKEDIAKVGAFFAKANDKLVYKFYLHVVCQLITMPDNELPSCALAVIFQLFSADMVVEAVESLLEQSETPEQNIRRTVSLLCEWLRMCNFCQNLNLWIMAILKGLHQQHKLALVNQIALDNIDQLFQSLIVPVLRPKVAPIVFHMLSSIDQTPEVFHKILPRFPRVIAMLKQQSNSSEDYAESTKKFLQQLVDRTCALMVRFYQNDLYEPIEQALKDFQPSINYLNYAYGTRANESFLYSGDSSTMQNPKVGLVNLGNTCYMNSVLQALAMTKEFSREILLAESSSPLLIKMQQQIAFMLYSTRHELTPSKVLNATRPPGFSPGLQQDSSEFLGYLLETLHEQEVAFRKKKQSCQDRAEFKQSQAEAEEEEMAGASAVCKNDEQASDAKQQNISDNPNKNTPTAVNTSSNTTTTDTQCTNIPAASSTSLASYNSMANSSTIEKTFTGKLATTYKCLTCGWKSCIIDCFRDLQLSFPDIKNDCASNYSVQDLIEYYCSPEKLYGDNQYFCEKCKKLSDAERFINVINAPKNLILTLKHFKYDQKYHMRAKLMHKVFHDEKVSLKVCSPEHMNEIATVHYDLYAGVVHSGFSMDSGHYYTYASDAANKWYKFNDSIVTPSKTEELHNLKPPNTPYILFYQMGARSNEAAEASASTKVIKVDVPTPLTLEELPRDLKDMVNRDNHAFSEELKTRRYKTTGNNMSTTNTKSKNSYQDDDDDDQPPPPAGCGGNLMNMNMNRFVY